MKQLIAMFVLVGSMGLSQSAWAQEAPVVPTAPAVSTPAPPAAQATPAATPPAPPAAPADVSTGTLVVEITPYTSEKPLPAKIEQQLKSAAVEFGVRDHQVVFSTVAKQFIDFPLSHMVRYGQSETLALPAGEYRITGIGLEVSFGFNVQKILNKGAFVNEDVMSFTIEPGKTTTLVIHSVYGRDTAGLNAFYLPNLMASLRGETGATPEQALNVRGEHSIAWPDYHGSLKFIAK